MGTDSCLVDCPKPKKSRPSVEDVNSNWCCLPTVILHEIFLLLNQSDRLNASSACKNWRQILYHPIWWKSVTFTIHENELSKARYLISAFGNIVSNATVRFDSMSPDCAEEFITLLYFLSENENLRTLVIEPKCCRIEFPSGQSQEECNMRYLVNVVKKCCRHPLQRFSFGGIEEVSKHVPDFLEILAANSPDNVTHLGLASVKDDPGNYKTIPFDLKLFTPFRKLQILSVDYDIVCDEFLKVLDNAAELSRLVVHVHGVDEGHVGTTELAWKNFKSQHKNCELRLSLIHAYDEVHFLENILKQNMPLSHLKVFFCETINLPVLHHIPTWYPETFRSLMWIDSQSYGEPDSSYIIVGQGADTAPDPLVMIAWLCLKLEEIVLIGYKYFVEDLIAIARLRSDTLKVLEVADDDIIYSQDYTTFLKSLSEEVTTVLKKPWAPLTSEDLHPVLCDSTAGDSDEYLLPRVLADLQ